MNVKSKQIKLEAWFVKGSCVLIKKKIQRGQWPANSNFQKLMAKALQTDDGVSSSEGEDGTGGEEQVRK